LLLDMGGFDESYFVSYGDLDLLSRLKQKHLQLLQHNGSYIVYHFGLSVDTRERDTAWIKDRKTYQKKWGTSQLLS